MTKSKTIIITLIFIGIFLRFYKLGELPNSYTPDEVAQAYTAYSFLQTGKDEWGNSNPFILRSFGDYKAPLQTWLMIPSIKLFGLTPYAARFPNALVSSLALITTVTFCFFLTRNWLATIFTAAIISLSPWHLPLSRLALEANFTVFLSTAGLTFWFSRPKSKLYQIIAVVFFALNLLSYHSAKLLTPAIVLITLIYQAGSLKPKTTFKALSQNKILVILFSLSLFLVFFQSLQSSARVGDISITHPTDNWEALSFDRYVLTQNHLPDLVSRLFQNKIVYIIKNFIQSYTSYFSFQFLLTQGAGETTYGMLPGFGVLGFVPLFGLVISLIILLSPDRASSKSIPYLVVIVLVSAIPAAIAKGNYPGNRLSGMIPFIIILSSIGLAAIFTSLPKLIKIILCFIFLYTSFDFLTSYFYGANNRLASGMLYGRQQAIEYINQFPSSKVLFSRSLSQPQAYYSFFTQIAPQITQSASVDWLRYSQENKNFLDQLGEYSLANATFKNISTEDFQLYDFVVGQPPEFASMRPTKIFYYPNSHQEAFYLYQKPHEN